MKESLILIVIVFLVVEISVITTLYKNWKYYKKVYETLDNKTFFSLQNDNDILFSDLFKENEFVYFVKTKDFKLKNDVYLHNTFFTYLDPYSLYWLKKYQKYFKNRLKNRFKNL